MDKEEINKNLERMVARPDLPRLNATALTARLLSHVLYNYDSLPESTVDDLFFVSACLLRDFCDDVEKDVLAVRNMMTRPSK